ncbi:YdcF family protein [Castellaniella sp.]|uniref:YdcF family protein n=1 Tax=Castellaniella sp. TaxID=1955812 RepID=UPI0035688F84
MSFSALLAQLILPWNLAAVLLLLALAVWALRWRKSALCMAGGAAAWVLLWSLPITSLWSGACLEQRYPTLRPGDATPRQAIVVLGGHTANGRTNWFEPYDPHKVHTRTHTAAELYLAGKAPLIIVSGAALDGGVSEAQLMAATLEQQAIPPSALVLENHSLTTRENALYSAELLRQLGIDSFFLVTSALHMPRAVASFRKLGLEPVAAPSPAQIIRPDRHPFYAWLPDGRSLQASRSIIKEYLGLLVYWLRGWA